jgi:hypothetical protein
MFRLYSHHQAIYDLRDCITSLFCANAQMRKCANVVLNELLVYFIFIYIYLIKVIIIFKHNGMSSLKKLVIKITILASRNSVFFTKAHLCVFNLLTV